MMALQAIHSVGQKAMAGMCLGALYGAIQLSFGSIRKSSKNAAETRRFEGLYPDLKVHADMEYCAKQLYDSQPYADKQIHDFIEACNTLAKKLVYFEENKNVWLKENPTKLIAYPREFYGQIFDIKRKSESLQTKLLGAKPDVERNHGLYTNTTKNRR